MNHLNISDRFSLKYIIAMRETFRYIGLQAFLFKRAIYIKECTHKHIQNAHIQNLLSHMCSQREKEQLDSCPPLATRTHTAAHTCTRTHTPAHRRTHMYSHTHTRTEARIHTRTRSFFPHWLPPTRLPPESPSFPSGLRTERTGKEPGITKDRAGAHKSHTRLNGSKSKGDAN